MSLASDTCHLPQIEYTQDYAEDGKFVRNICGYRLLLSAQSAIIRISEVRAMPAALPGGSYRLMAVVEKSQYEDLKRLKRQTRQSMSELTREALDLLFAFKSRSHLRYDADKIGKSGM
jgi:hypothetical protein